MGDLKDNIKYIRVNNGRCDTEISVETLRSEKCCYTYTEENQKKQFKGKLGWIDLTAYVTGDTNTDGHKAGLEGLVGKAVLKKGELVVSVKDQNAFALYFPQLTNIE